MPVMGSFVLYAALTPQLAPAEQIQSGIPVERPGPYQAIFTTDDGAFGGFDRVSKSYRYLAQVQEDGRIGFFTYLPSRTAVVFKKID